MRIIEVESYKEMSRLAARMIGGQVALKPNCVLGLATGSSPIGTYEELAADYQAGILDFSQVRTVNLDEYCGLTPDNPQSYRYFMDLHLFGKVNVDKANTHLPNGAAPANSRLFDRVEDVPTQAVTMGIGAIMKAKRVLLIAGPDKKEIVEKAFRGPVTPQVPASILQLHRDATVIFAKKDA